jgi:hypothetical protein
VRHTECVRSSVASHTMGSGRQGLLLAAAVTHTDMATIGMCIAHSQCDSKLRQQLAGTERSG